MSPDRSNGRGKPPILTIYSKPFDSKEKGELPKFDGKI